jgi:hypothetical protein
MFIFYHHNVVQVSDTRIANEILKIGKIEMSSKEKNKPNYIKE